MTHGREGWRTLGNEAHNRTGQHPGGWVGAGALPYLRVDKRAEAFTAVCVRATREWDMVRRRHLREADAALERCRAIIQHVFLLHARGAEVLVELQRRALSRSERRHGLISHVSDAHDGGLALGRRTESAVAVGR